ncbi:MAG: prepilin-type N-terminal cleavage/methylation domain-containing protein [Lachnospiraceae bacterium]
MEQEIKRKNPHNNCEGFSLIEVLIASAILMLITLPLFQGFVTSALINVKSKNLFRATTIAQNEMEDIKASDMNELLTRHLALEETPGVWKYSMPVFEDGKTYQVSVSFNANGYQNQSKDGYNDIQLADISNINSATDGIFVQNNHMDQDAARELKTFFLKKDDPSLEEIMDTMSRTITITVEKIGTSTDAYAKITYYFNGIEVVGQEFNRIYHNTNEDVKFKNYYLFFQPMYGDLLAGPRETIHIENKDGIPMDVYLVKQKTVESTSSNEAKYRVNVSVHEENRKLELDEAGIYHAATNIRTNLLHEFGNTQLSLHHYGRENLTGITDARQLCNLKGLVAKKQTNRFYEVEVKVADEKGKTLAKLTGTKEK